MGSQVYFGQVQLGGGGLRPPLSSSRLFCMRGAEVDHLPLMKYRKEENFLNASQNYDIVMCAQLLILFQDEIVFKGDCIC